MHFHQNEKIWKADSIFMKWNNYIFSATKAARVTAPGFYINLFRFLDIPLIKQRVLNYRIIHDEIL